MANELKVADETKDFRTSEPASSSSSDIFQEACTEVVDILTSAPKATPVAINKYDLLVASEEATNAMAVLTKAHAEWDRKKREFKGTLSTSNQHPRCKESVAEAELESLLDVGDLLHAKLLAMMETVRFIRSLFF